MTNFIFKRAACFIGVSVVACAYCEPAMADLTPDDSLNTEVIIKPESGTVISGLYRSGVSGYYYFGFGETKEIDGEEGVIAIDGSDIYLYNPVLGAITNTWIKGSMAEDGTVTVSTPQLISGGPDAGFAYYLMNGVFDESDMTADVNEEVSTIKYSYVDGKLSLVSGCPSIFEYTVPYDEMGEPKPGMSEQWVWSGDIGFSDELVPYPEMGESAPDELKTSDYILYSQSEGVTEGRPVNAGVDGDTFWAQGLEVNVPEAWVKGKIDGDRVTFTAQFMCFDSKQHLFQFLLPAVAVKEDGVTVGYEIADKIEMDYDRTSGTLSSKEGETLFVNAGVKSIYALTRYEEPEFRPESPLSSLVPADPQIVNYNPYNEEWGFGNVDVALPQVNVKGEYLNPDMMFYTIYSGNEPVAVDEVLFPEVPDVMWEIPYFYANGTIMASGAVHSLSFMGEIKDLGFKLIYYDENGDSHESNIVNVEGAGVSAIEGNPVKEVYYTDLNGMRLSAPAKGICIRTTVLSDGSRISSKIVSR